MCFVGFTHMVAGDMLYMFDARDNALIILCTDGVNAPQNTAMHSPKKYVKGNTECNNECKKLIFTLMAG